MFFKCKTSVITIIEHEKSIVSESRHKTYKTINKKNVWSFNVLSRSQELHKIRPKGHDYVSLAYIKLTKSCLLCAKQR